jgi:hypothetical protein
MYGPDNSLSNGGSSHNLGEKRNTESWFWRLINSVQDRS